jgi:hypothetical protein
MQSATLSTTQPTTRATIGTTDQSVHEPATPSPTTRPIGGPAAERMPHSTNQSGTPSATPSATPSERSTHSPLPRPSALQAVLMVTSMAGAENCAASLAGMLGQPVEIASSRKFGLSALRRRDYAMVIVDETIAEADPAGADLLWKHSGLAVPLQINFALLGCARLGREVKAALARREQERSLALRAATSTLENDLKSTVTGLLLQSELALAEPSVPPQLASKLKLMVELAGTLRRRLEQPRT